MSKASQEKDDILIWVVDKAMAMNLLKNVINLVEIKRGTKVKPRMKLLSTWSAVLLSTWSAKKDLLVIIIGRS